MPSLETCTGYIPGPPRGGIVHIRVPCSWNTGVTSVLPNFTRNVGEFTKLEPRITTLVPVIPLGGNISVSVGGGAGADSL